MAKMTSSGGNFGAALTPGSRTGGGRYVLKRLVGRGEFSELWLARDVKNVKDVALKFLPQAFLSDANLLELFQNEVARIRLLQHPHIIPVYELARDHDSAAIVMEYIDGWSLATMKVDKLGKCYTVDEIEPRIRELCSALAYAHKEFGLIHGDLKPSNLLLSTREGIKISDFGFAVMIRNESSKRGIIKSGYSGIGFLSPQQVMGEPPSKLDDIYSLGATIFDLLTGTPPFYKGEVIAQICSLKPASMTQRLAELGVQCDPVPAIWEQIVAACLAKNPADRPQNADEFLQMLESGEVPSVSASATEPEDADEPPDVHEAAPPIIDAPVPAEAPPLVHPSPVSPANATKIAVLFGCLLAAFVMAILAAGLWLIHSGKFAALNFNLASHRGGTLDKSFNSGTGADNFIRCLALQPDGKILIGGLFTNFNGVVSRKIARLETNGTLDVTFTPQVEGNVYAMVLQIDGKIVIGGQGLRPRRPNRRFLRLAPDGSRDAQFPGEGTFNGNVRTVAVQPDGGILVGGDFSKISSKEHYGLARLVPNGGFDDSFNFSPDATVTVSSMAVQPDGKILVVSVINPAITRLLRLNPDGSPDPEFNPSIDADIRRAFLQKDGRILVCGSIDTNGASSSYITRFNPDGSLDKSFNFIGVKGDVLGSMALQADGKIIIGGHNEINQQVHPVLDRLNTDGSPDASFQITGATGGSIWSLVVQPDGKILAAGELSSLDGAPCGNIVRLQN